MSAEALTIGRLATESGVSRDALRYYEREGLLAPAAKTGAGYRLYEANAVRRIRFIQHAQRCGFTLAEIHDLLDLRQAGDACCADVRQRAIDKRQQLRNRIGAMQAMAVALDDLIAACTDGQRSVDDCPILAALERAGAHVTIESSDGLNVMRRKEGENGVA
ncbi:heavy metal-responsive transcriptional regulator [Burkholderia cepacia]|uniref:Heavy metal-responsive transcriptional regulator n=1 Tax=Burkholderia cepacia TaxID=292 RepID=A0AAX2RQP1_BURCE|nr:heavy metal-responsive transcriptional regulator [Burkholderia cepacia]TES62196.1 heavy metal-responsive transcriptional regulator [Burkholderia cepacia]TET01612.1 heavy metal-responsive transcriptional regulator [Burkholderia cepacia]TEU47470.1 heavy metal-responsive transcriptional regulator [Burkholderia cepacia]TEU53497.1 heavy metal-responsive transcriptional regulator [Burkholderia cepacia]TEV02103.1 heavy metal-responsive transcriptional regulator [Burkholderia cepacia]